ncbi:MAG: LptF/LptG family permease, partial [Sulfuricellaceae bacterium]|nr:LptF/LptG family permease [Sulfuricellaceae bacterium]
GRRYEGLPGSAEFRIVEFARYAVRIEPYEAKQGAVSSKSLPTLALIQQHTPVYLGELLWRLGLPVSAFILALLAIPLSFVNPRAGRSMNLIFAVLIYMVYSNLISIVQAWVVQGKISFVTGIWSVHLFMVAVLLVLFYRRLSLRRPVGKRLGLS